MGAFSEMDMELRAQEAPFFDGDTIFPGLAQGAAEDQSNRPIAFADEAKQQAEAEAAPAALARLNGQPAAQPQQTDSGDKDADEDTKRKAHEEAEAKRKAEFDARQAAKKAAEQEQLDRLAAMSDDEVMAASMKRVSDDTEKLTRRNMKECVAEHIQTMCIEDPAFARKTMHPRKSMIRCFQYISRKAWEYVQDELKANGIRPGPGQQAYGADVPDGLCYQWAVDYFNDPDVKEDHEDEEKFEPQPYRGGSSRSKAKAKTKGAAKKPAEKPAAKKPEPIQKAAAKKADDAGQLTLGGFMMPEEKAG